jgi:hypothetical protein
MFIIRWAMIEESVALERFACDLPRCRGACCTLSGGRGAPLLDAEVGEIERAFPAARKYLSDVHSQVIAGQGMVEGSPGSYATVCVGNRACVFVVYEGDCARCALEMAYLEGKTAWRKPLSCHLFPIRVSTLGGAERLRYEQVPECLPGRGLGSERGIPLHEFLKEALVRANGAKWYDEFLTECRRRFLGA